MTESSPTNRLIKASATVSRWLLWPLVAFWVVLLLAWGGLHGWIVPRIGDWRPQLEQMAGQALGVPVRIGSLTARSESLLPTFEAADVVLLDAEGREALRLPRVVGTLSPGSLWNQGFEQLFIDKPELDIRRTAQGHILLAGLDFAQSSSGNSHDGADWLFSQTEVFIRHGTVRWTDEKRGTPTLALSDVSLLLRNGARRHGLRLDATPPPEWGQRLSLRAQFRQPLLSTRHSRWQEWDGQAYADFAQVDVSHLKQYLDLGSLGVSVQQGHGALRVWTDVNHGEPTGATADVALYNVNTRLGPELAPLELEQVRGRVAVKSLAAGFEVSTEGLQFTTHDGLRWPGGNAFVSYTQAEARIPAQVEFRADKLDLQALSQIANRLPLGSATHAALLAYRPKGLIERIQAHWQGPIHAIQKYTASGRVVGLEIASQPAVAASGAGMHPGIPGVRGLTADFDLNQSGGKAKLTLVQGALDFPGVFDESSIAFDQLSSDVQWLIEGEQVSLQLANTRFANTDAQGELSAQWRTSDPAKASNHARFPGNLDLQGSLSRADASRVYRYLPKVMPETRDYLRAALVQGQASGVKFRLKGDLIDVPFANPKLGEFHITANVSNAVLAYIPRAIQGKDEVPWPALSQLAGEFVYDRNSLQVKSASGVLQQSPGFSLSRGDVQITDLTKAPVLVVSTDAKGPVQDVFHFLATSPVGGWLGHGLDKATGTGSADYRLRLTVPLTEVAKTRLQGSVNLAGNDLHFTPESPVLGRTRGQIQYTEGGFSLTGVQARMLGGDARIEGGMKPTGTTGESAMLLRAQGVLTGEGLRNSRELGVWSRLARDASGSTAYSATFGIRQGVPELGITSNLQGLALGLPAPLNKTAEGSLPLRIETALTPEPGAARGSHDRVTVELGKLLSVAYVRDVSGRDARVLRGAIQVGQQPGETARMPGEGVAASINLNAFDISAWDALLTQATVAPVGERSAASGVNANDPLLGYLPNTMVVRANELNHGPYQLNHVVGGGSRDGLTWRANVHADELSGYMEFRQPSPSNPGRFHARLARLSITPKAVQQVESLLDDQPSDIPALDVVVDEFELRGKKLGRVEIDAVNRIAVPRDPSTREWRLNKFNISNPEASFTASGNWAAVSGATNPVLRASTRRRTVMNYKLDLVDAGELLARLGMKDVVRRGKGKLEGQVSWLGSPLSPDYASLGGQFNVDVQNGQFLQVDPGAAKLLGVLSLQSLPRRLTLDFRDFFSSGFAFDSLRGEVHISNGLASTKNLQVKGVAAAALMEGQADIVRETQDLRVVVVPEINAGTASLLASIANPLYGIVSLVGQWILRNPLIEANTREFHITGTWTEPSVVQVDHKPAKPAVAPPDPTASAPTSGSVTP